MQGSSWTSLIERIPSTLHDSLAVTLVTGSEILVQSIFRLEEEIMVLRGRMAGSTDAGRVIMLPYDQIVSLAFTKRMPIPEMQSIFGEGMAPIISKSAAAPAAAAAESEEEALLGPGEEEVVPEEARLAPLSPLAPASLADAPTNADKKASPPSKSLLLARLRARLAEQSK